MVGKRFGLLLCCLWGLSSGLRGQPSEALERLLEAVELRHAVIGISVKAVADGRIVIDRSGDKSLQPASVCKLLSSALALKEKGADFHYTTSVWRTGTIADGKLNGDIVIEANGDPCFDSRYFPEYKFTDRLVDAIRQLNIRQIRGKIRIENDKQVVLPGSWLWEDISNYYGAAYFPFNYKDNTYYLRFRTGLPGEKTVLLNVDPEQPGVRFVNEVKAAEGNTDDAWIFGGPYSKEMHILGTLPQKREVFQIKGAMHRPDLCFLEEIGKKLNKTGIVVGGVEIAGGGKKEKIETFVSPALKDIVRETNKKSINLFAEALGQLVDEINYPERCRVLLDETGVGASGVVLKDACGLSAANAVPAEVFTNLLLWAHKMLGWNFVASLPLAGTDAGLNPYVAANPALKNKLRAKTGSFAGVRCLSGYLTTKRGEILAFTILVNHFDGSPSLLQKKIGEFLCSFL
ncbi:D-alanyl-D-alanine carboxypeptidase/D-alanyl-D-alanine-endopeptidase [uncultured Culturomica sp.]|uniref:D-alanyl-D-alanine carboxypeptidase/D-alanyl-D-alanine endopeptidase n=1 Tax=uncultured Culturomica sp. TaxID=1926654 RepID=UPI0003405893|nr:D-alanyl-D-alanine carboxypeptidase/D-alanyl-D-alanine-endopeptidase [uncultured Culturomica sp.]CCZ09989.1 d-alanyl-D-alaninecarboxypeptidase/D-alanyl-D-alanine-endopeptidase [Odoribacter sp. CAG:788]